MLRGSTTDDPTTPPADTMIRPSLRALAVALLVLVAAGCGGQDESEADVKAKVADQLVDTGLDQEQADCFADVIVDELGADAVKDVDFSADQPPADMEEEFVQAATKALTTCDLGAEPQDG